MEELGVDNPLLHRDLSGGTDKCVLFSGSKGFLLSSEPPEVVLSKASLSDLSSTVTDE